MNKETSVTSRKEGFASPVPYTITVIFNWMVNIAIFNFLGRELFTGSYCTLLTVDLRSGYDAGKHEDNKVSQLPLENDFEDILGIRAVCDTHCTCTCQDYIS